MGPVSLSPTFHKKPLLNLEHQVLKKLRLLELKPQSLCLLAVSGGLDSVALLACLYRLKPLLQWDLAVVHVHHGPSPESSRQETYRQQAWQTVSDLADELKLPFYSNRMNHSAGPMPVWVGEPRAPLKSEQDFRDYRYQVIEQVREDLSSQASQAVFTALAHNANDQLETRLIQMARGTGTVGLNAMGLFSQLKLRPFIDYTRHQLADYAHELELNWLEDPSNHCLDPLRNWMRHEWLPQLEQKRPGSVASLARSLEQVTGEIQQNRRTWQGWIVNGAVVRPRFLELDRQQKGQLLVHYLRQQGLKGYSQSHIEELLKRLDTSRKDLTFRLLKRSWKVSRDRIEILRD